MFEFSRRKNKTKNIKICPKCKKSSLTQIFGGMVAARYKCTSCDYEGTFYLEVNPEEAGENFVNLEKLKKVFHDDVDPTTEIDITSEDTLKHPLQEKKK